MSKLLDNEQCSQVDYFHSTALSFVWYCLLNAHGEYCGLLDVDGTLRSTDSNINTCCYFFQRRHIYATRPVQIPQNVHLAVVLIPTIITWHSNRTLYRFLSGRSYISYDLWNSCGVKLPGTCESTLSLYPSDVAVKVLMQGGIPGNHLGHCYSYDVYSASKKSTSRQKQITISSRVANRMMWPS